MDPPVSRNCGWAVGELGTDNKLRLLDKFTQVIDREPGNLASLEDVYQKLSELIDKYKATVLCMERQMGGGLFFARAKLNEFVGAAKLCCHRKGVVVVEISPSHLKCVIASHGKAPKKKIMNNVKTFFGLDETGAEHECDAAAFMLTYFIDKGWGGYSMTDPYTDDDRKEEKRKKAKRLAKKKAKEAQGKGESPKG
jgi:Holliday junction resolvasome RuvABC endonuclease subunit